MAKQLFIAAFLVDPAEYYTSGDPVDSGFVVSDLAQSSFGEQAGVSDFMVWSGTKDFLKDHTERGPIDAAYLEGERTEPNGGGHELGAGLLSTLRSISASAHQLANDPEQANRGLWKACADQADAAIATCAPDPDDKLIVVLDGGLVQSVVGTGAYVGRTVHIVDYDTDGADTSELSEIGQGDGGTVDAFYRIETIGKSEITLPEMEGR